VAQKKSDISTTWELSRNAKSHTLLTHIFIFVSFYMIVLSVIILESILELVLSKGYIQIVLRCFQNQGFARHQYITPVILATQEAEVRRIMVQSQAGQIVHETVSQQNLLQKMGW
jgi:hypothetical protein